MQSAARHPPRPAFTSCPVHSRKAPTHCQPQARTCQHGTAPASLTDTPSPHRGCGWLDAADSGCCAPTGSGVIVDVGCGEPPIRTALRLRAGALTWPRTPPVLPRHQARACCREPAVRKGPQCKPWALSQLCCQHTHHQQPRTSLPCRYTSSRKFGPPSSWYARDHRSTRPRASKAPDTSVSIACCDMQRRIGRELCARS